MQNNHQASSASISAINQPNTAPPPCPPSLPYPATEENIPKLKAFILDQFKDSAFNNKTIPFPSMSAPPAHIHLKLDALNPLEGGNKIQIR